MKDCTVQGVARMGKDALAKYLGIEIEEIRPGYARARMKVTEHLLNGVNVTHGGAVFSLADVVFAAASNAHGPVALALNVNINFFRPTKSGDTLIAEATEENLTKQTGVYRMEVKNEKKQKVAVAHGTVFRKNEEAALD